MEPTTRSGSMVSGTLWMTGLSVLTFWFPVVGPIIAGFVGGNKSGSIGSAVISAIIPAILVALLLFLLGSAFDLPLIGALVGAGVFIVILIASIPLFIAAIIGGALAERGNRI